MYSIIVHLYDVSQRYGVRKLGRALGKPCRALRKPAKYLFWIKTSFCFIILKHKHVYVTFTQHMRVENENNTCVSVSNMQYIECTLLELQRFISFRKTLK